MTVSARERILARIRSANRSVTDGDPASRLRSPPDLIRPAVGNDPVKRFIERLQRNGGSAERARDDDHAVERIGELVSANRLPARLRVAAALEGMPWGDELEVLYGRSDGNDLVSVTPCFCAIAETGSVMLLSGASSPTTLNFLPDVHIVLVYPGQLVTHLEDAWLRLRQSAARPRTVNLVTGPSKTADVEQTLQIGAHGPRRFHVILVGEAACA